MVTNSVKLSTITITYNNAENIKEFTTSLLKRLPKDTEIIILDNDSTDSTVDILSKYPVIKLIKSDKNLGFGKGCNKAASQAAGEYLLFLNPDVEIDENIPQMVDFLERNPKVGILVPKLLDSDGKPQNSVTKIPTLLGAIKEFILGMKNEYSEYYPNVSDPTEIEGAYGAAFLIKKNLFNKLKGFDERYFLYYEDLDLCSRVRGEGLKIVYFPHAEFIHHKGLSVKSIPIIEQNKLGRVVSWFFPIKSSGSRYYNVLGSNIFHGQIKSLLIRLVIFLSLKLNKK